MQSPNIFWSLHVAPLCKLSQWELISIWILQASNQINIKWWFHVSGLSYSYTKPEQTILSSSPLLWKVRPGFDSQCPHCSSQKSITLVALNPFLWLPQVPGKNPVYRHMCRQTLKINGFVKWIFKQNIIFPLIIRT